MNFKIGDFVKCKDISGQMGNLSKEKVYKVSGFNLWGDKSATLELEHTGAFDANRFYLHQGDEIKLTKDRIQEAASKCPVAAKTLRILAPEAFEGLVKFGELKEGDCYTLIPSEGEIPRVKAIYLFLGLTSRMGDSGPLMVCVRAGSKTPFGAIRRWAKGDHVFVQKVDFPYVEKQ